jgi:hypothetical protein
MKTHTIKHTPYWIIIAILSFITIFFLLLAVVNKQDADRNMLLAQKNEKKAEQQMKLALIAQQQAEDTKKLMEERLKQAEICCNKKQDLK